MRDVVKATGSKRRLTERDLVVNWEGSEDLIYRMSKARVKSALASEVATVRESFSGNVDIKTFPVRRFRSGSIAIGCEHFSKAEVAELKKWSRA